MKLRAPDDVHAPRVEDDFWHGAEPYSDKASPDQDQRRDELEDLPEPATRAEPDPIDAPPETEPGPIPYVLDGPGPLVKRDPAAAVATDAIGMTRTLDTSPTILADEDHQRRRVVVQVAAGDVALLAFGHNARSEVESVVTSFTVDGTLEIRTTARIAARAEAGTAEVRVLIERDGL